MVETSLKRIIIAAVSRNGIIGNNNQIPWNSKEEILHFKKTTIDHPIILGNNTFKSIGRILPNRMNLVISAQIHKAKINIPSLYFFKSVQEAYDHLRKNDIKKVFICGGERIYRNTIKHAEEMIISHMNINALGDKKFPTINPKIWKITGKQKFNDFSLVHYRRKYKSD